MALTTVPVELANLDGAVTINEAGADADFRIEGDSQQNLFVVNGGTDDIGIGMSDPTFATGNGMQFADDFYLGFGTGNGTRPDFTIHGDNNGLEIACGTGADTADITIDTAGKVGISTTSPQAELHVKDASAGSRIIVEASASGQEADIQMKTADDGQGWVLFNNGSANQGAIKYNHASDYMSFRTNGTEKLRINDGQGIWCLEVPNNGDYSMYIGSICAAGSGNRYAHVQLSTAGGDMYWVEVVGFDYTASIIDGRAGGYVYNYASQTPPYSTVYNGSVVNQFQNTDGYVEIVIDTTSASTGNRWGSYVLRGGTDTITSSAPLEILQYSYTSTTTKVY